MLVFFNKTERDIILRSEFEGLDGLKCPFTVTDQPGSPLAQGMIDEAFLQRHVGDFEQKFYVCGPPKMVEDISRHLEGLGADADGIVLDE